MKQRAILAAAAAAFLVPAAASAQTVINFDNLAVGTIVSNQYAGVTFTANAFSGTGSSSSNQPWATNTDLSVVSATGGNVGGLGTPSLVSGNILHSFGNTGPGWLTENGDPSFSINFAAPISSFSAVFAGVFTPADVRIFLYNGATLLATVAGTGTGGTNSQFVLSYAAPSITRVAVAPGSFDDWVGVDNITYTSAVTAVPESATWAMMITGFGMVGGSIRYRRRNTKVAFA